MFFKKDSSKKLNNKGFSLVEVLVAMAVISIISIPLVRGFLTSAKMNARARRLQNATDMAQNMAEIFSSEDLNALLEQYTYADSSNSVQGTKIYTFDPIAKTGAGDEKFTVNIKMTSDPADSYDVPALKNFFGEDEVVCVKEITKYDKVAESNLGTTAANIHKTTTIDVETDSDGTYVYTVSVKYTSTSGGTFGEDNIMTLRKGSIIDEDGNRASEFPALYILYTPYNYNASSGNIDDTVIVNYINNDTNIDEGVKVFLIPEGDDDTTISSSAFSRLETTSNGAPYVAGSAATTMDFTVYDGSSSALTQGSRKARVYDVYIEVVYRGDVLTKLNTVREDIEQ